MKATFPAVRGGDRRGKLEVFSECLVGHLAVFSAE